MKDSLCSRIKLPAKTSGETEQNYLLWFLAKRNKITCQTQPGMADVDVSRGEKRAHWSRKDWLACSWTTVSSGMMLGPKFPPVRVVRTCVTSNRSLWDSGLKQVGSNGGLHGRSQRSANPGFHLSRRRHLHVVLADGASALNVNYQVSRVIDPPVDSRLSYPTWVVIRVASTKGKEANIGPS